MDKRLRVSVVMGGPSAEHEISLKSGEGVVSALRQRGCAAEALRLPKDLSVSSACRFLRQALRAGSCEVVFLALHGTFGEDGTIQSLCEDLGLPYTGSDPRASQLGLDKAGARRCFEEAGLAVPRWHLIDSETHPSPRILLNGLAFPLVVKPIRQGSSLGVSVVTGEEALLDAVELASLYGSPILVEEFIRGRELTVGILGEQALPVVEIQPPGGLFDYTAKYTPGMTRYLVPAELSSELAASIQEAGLRAHRAIGCRHFSRVDLILDEQRQPVILEINTIPGLTPTSLLPKAAASLGLSYEELCEQLVLMALEKTPPARHGVTEPPAPAFGRLGPAPTNVSQMSGPGGQAGLAR